MSALVVGSTGFIGTELVKCLRAEGKPYALLNRRKSAGEAAQQFLLEDIEHISPDHSPVFIISAAIPRRGAQVDELLLQAVNVELPRKLCAHFSRSKIVYASSVSVYAAPKSAAVDEGYPTLPETAYGRSKLEGERLVLSRPDACALRFSSVYGPGMHNGTFMPTIIRQALREQQITLHGSGTRLQNYLYVSDAARMLYAAGFSQSTGAFNAVDVCSYSNADVAAMIAARLEGVTVRHEGEDTSPSCTYSNKRWREHFHVTPSISLSEGLSEVIDYVRTLT